MMKKTPSVQVEAVIRLLADQQGPLSGQHLDGLLQLLSTEVQWLGGGEGVPESDRRTLRRHLQQTGELFKRGTWGETELLLRLFALFKNLIIHPTFSAMRGEVWPLATEFIGAFLQQLGEETALDFFKAATAGGERSRRGCGDQVGALVEVVKRRPGQIHVWWGILSRTVFESVVLQGDCNRRFNDTLNTILNFYLSTTPWLLANFRDNPALDVADPIFAATDVIFSGALCLFGEPEYECVIRKTIGFFNGVFNPIFETGSGPSGWCSSEDDIDAVIFQLGSQSSQVMSLFSPKLSEEGVRLMERLSSGEQQSEEFFNKWLYLSIRGLDVLLDDVEGRSVQRSRGGSMVQKNQQKSRKLGIIGQLLSIEAIAAEVFRTDFRESISDRLYETIFPNASDEHAEMHFSLFLNLRFRSRVISREIDAEWVSVAYGNLKRCSEERRRNLVLSITGHLVVALSPVLLGFGRDCFRSSVEYFDELGVTYEGEAVQSQRSYFFDYTADGYDYESARDYAVVFGEVMEKATGLRIREYVGEVVMRVLRKVGRVGDVRFVEAALLPNLVENGDVTDFGVFSEVLLACHRRVPGGFGRMGYHFAKYVQLNIFRDARCFGAGVEAVLEGLPFANSLVLPLFQKLTTGVDFERLEKEETERLFQFLAFGSNFDTIIEVPEGSSLPFAGHKSKGVRMCSIKTCAFNTFTALCGNASEDRDIQENALFQMFLLQPDDFVDFFGETVVAYVESMKGSMSPLYCLLQAMPYYEKTVSRAAPGFLGEIVQAVGRVLCRFREGECDAQPYRILINFLVDVALLTDSRDLADSAVRLLGSREHVRGDGAAVAKARGFLAGNAGKPAGTVIPSRFDVGAAVGSSAVLVSVGSDCGIAVSLSTENGSCAYTVGDGEFSVPQTELLLEGLCSGFGEGTEMFGCDAQQGDWVRHEFARTGRERANVTVLYVPGGCSDAESALRTPYHETSRGFRGFLHSSGQKVDLKTHFAILSQGERYALSGSQFCWMWSLVQAEVLYFVIPLITSLGSLRGNGRQWRELMGAPVLVMWAEGDGERILDDLGACVPPVVVCVTPLPRGLFGVRVVRGSVFGPLRGPTVVPRAHLSEFVQWTALSAALGGCA